MHPVTRFLVGGFLASSLLASAWVALFQLQLGKPTQFSARLHELILFKQDVLRADRGPRVMVAGGSNITFSFSAALLSDYTPNRAFNFGTHAGLDLGYILELVEAEARPGDTLVLALEYEHFGYKGKNTAVKLDYICGCDPDYLSRLTLVQRTRILFSFNLLGLTEPNLSLIRRAMQVSKPIGPVRRGAAVPYLNQHGDAISHTRERQTFADAQAVLDDHPTNLAFDGREESWRLLSDFLGRMQSCSIRVLQTWPVTRDYDYYSSEEARKAFARIETFFTMHGVPTLGIPEDFMFPPDCFFDSVYHLIDAYKEEPTRTLGRLLMIELETLGPTQRPQAPDASIGEG